MRRLAGSSHGHFLLVQKWEPNFVALEVKQLLTAVWIRLPQHLTEFNDGIILQTIRNKVGMLLKIDACTSATLRGRYARLCVKIPLDYPVKLYIIIGSHKQHILYEGDNFLCKRYGRLGHSSLHCSYVVLSSPQETMLHANSQQITTNTNGGEWQTAVFLRRKKFPQKTKAEQIGESPATGINVKIFDASTSKYLNIQKLKYKSKDLPLELHTDKRKSRLVSETVIPPVVKPLHGKNNFLLLENQPMVYENTTNKKTTI
ncbi:uncharacterized protein [Nicotiana sylvestris]|uniref:uncharacterized protein n=1 Tax=Nicotiana sylvestris TaxID=4096 RepID=UPI00388C7BB6